MLSAITFISKHDQGWLVPRLEAVSGLQHVLGHRVVFEQWHKERPFGNPAHVQAGREGSRVGIGDFFREPLEEIFSFLKQNGLFEGPLRRENA